MKFIPIIVFILNVSLVSTQSIEQSHQLDYCGVLVQFKGDCQSGSPYQIICDDYSAQWLFIESHNVNTRPLEVIHELEEKLANTKTEKIAMYSFGQKMTGSLITYTLGGEENYFLTGYGMVNGYGVLLLVGLKVKPIRNDVLPPFISNLITINNSPY
ncbi:MAG: hypothetical protein ACI8XB_001996 [Patiriisocius sp.]|jgi:hypothetical protein